MKQLLIFVLALHVLPLMVNAQVGRNGTTFERINGYCAGSERTSRPLIGVMSFENKVSDNYWNNYRYQSLADGMVDALTNALVETQCFRVVERQRMNDLMQEQNLGLYGAVNPNSAASIGQMSGAQLLVMGTLTEVKELENAGIIGGAVKILGKKVGGGMAKWDGRISMIIRIVNSTTGEVLVSKSIDKTVTKVGVAAGGSILGVPVGGGLFKSKALPQAIEEALIDVAELIVRQKEQIGEVNAPSASGTSYIIPSSCSLTAMPDKPSFMVVIPEEHLSRPVPDPAGETEIIRQLIDLGFDVVDPQQIAIIRDQEKVQAALTDPSAAARLGREFAADIIIVGEAFSEFASSQNGRQVCRARVEARAIETATGKILTAHGTHATGVDIAEFVAGKDALRNAGSDLVQYFVTNLCSKTFSNSGNQGKTIEITLANADFGKLSKLSKALQTYDQVKLVEKSLSGKIARVEVSIECSIDHLAEYLYEEDLGYAIEIVGLDASKIDLVAL